MPITIPQTIRVLLPGGSVKKLPLETYVRGVVTAALPDDAPLEALKAQAVASRTFGAITRRHIEHGADVCTRRHCQLWTEGATAGARRAADETRGIVAIHDGRLIDAYYFEHCDGNTREAAGILIHVPAYLRSVSCPCGFATLKGHGVGMCQRGAQVKARFGDSYVEILNHYFKGITLERASGILTTAPGPDASPASLRSHTRKSTTQVPGQDQELPKAPDAPRAPAVRRSAHASPARPHIEPMHPVKTTSDQAKKGTPQVEDSSRTEPPSPTSGAAPARSAAPAAQIKPTAPTVEAGHGAKADSNTTQPLKKTIPDVAKSPKMIPAEPSTQNKALTQNPEAPPAAPNLETRTSPKALPKSTPIDSATQKSISRTVETGQSQATPESQAKPASRATPPSASPPPPAEPKPGAEILAARKVGTQPPPEQPEDLAGEAVRPQVVSAPKAATSASRDVVGPRESTILSFDHGQVPALAPKPISRASEPPPTMPESVTPSKRRSISTSLAPNDEMASAVDESWYPIADEISPVTVGFEAEMKDEAREAYEALAEKPIAPPRSEPGHPSVRSKEALPAAANKPSRRVGRTGIPGLEQEKRIPSPPETMPEELPAVQSGGAPSSVHSQIAPPPPIEEEIQERPRAAPATQLLVDRLPGPRMIAGNLPAPGTIITIRDAAGHSIVTVSGAAPHNGRGGFEAPLADPGKYDLVFDHQALQVDIGDETIFVQLPG